MNYNPNNSEPYCWLTKIVQKGEWNEHYMKVPGYVFLEEFKKPTEDGRMISRGIKIGFKSAVKHLTQFSKRATLDEEAILEKYDKEQSSIK